MLLGRGQGTGSANVHATVPGKVIRTVSWKMPNGYTNDALVIRLEGAFDKLGHRREILTWRGLSPFDLRRLIAEYGIVEMEQPGFPVADLLAAFRSRGDSSTLVVRCVFDDPWLAADYVLCRERMKAVAEGSAIAAHAGQAGRIVFAVSHQEEGLGDAYLAEMADFDIPVSVAITGSRYPQRNRRELEMALKMYARKENFELGNILSLGPATLAAIHDAIKMKQPILDRYVAVGGSAVKNPQVMKVRIGTRIGDLFAECGGFIDKPKCIATGSPLQGRTVVDLDEPVIKTSFAVFALLKGQIGGTCAWSCIGCGWCRNVCPVGLDPEALFKAAKAREGPVKYAGECHGCGCCEVVCPSRLPLSTVILNSAEEA
jgi:electron transport complex protein RnfC